VSKRLLKVEAHKQPYFSLATNLQPRKATAHHSARKLVFWNFLCHGRDFSSESLPFAGPPTVLAQTWPTPTIDREIFNERIAERIRRFFTHKRDAFQDSQNRVDFWFTHLR
jgi:hypothetical protein